MSRRWPWRNRRHRFRLIALLSFRDEMRFLPDYFANVAPQVDDIVALDDGSSDGSGEFVARQPKVRQLLRHDPHGDADWDDAGNHRELVLAAQRLGPAWLLGLDADERLEHEFRDRAQRIVAASDVRAYAVRFFELWDSPTQYRSDGVWGRKASARLFESRPDHEFHMQRLHCHWAPLNSRVDGHFVPADLNVYHLRMMREPDRIARRIRYQTLDPQRDFQAMGYEYLTDPTGIELSAIPPDRTYTPLPCDR